MYYLQNPFKSIVTGRGKGGKMPHALLRTDLDREIGNGLTPLHMAAQNNNVSKVKELVRRSCGKIF